MRSYYGAVFIALVSCSVPSAVNMNGDAGGVGGNGGNGGSGSGGSGGAAPEWVSGSRLRARVQTSTDGAKAFLGWYDSQLKLNCTFERASDDTQRCLPIDTQVDTQTPYFSDAKCTNAARIASSSGNCPASYAYQVDYGSTCVDPSVGMSFYVFHVFAITPTTAQLYTQTIGSACNAVMMRSNTTYYLVGDESPASLFVQGSVVTE
jgi:hypothetical protein